MQEKSDGQWTKKSLKAEKFPEVLWRVSWSVSGHLLAVSGGDNKVSLWKQNLEGQWEVTIKTLSHYSIF
jgi:protein transport protein SEC13